MMIRTTSILIFALTGLVWGADTFTPFQEEEVPQDVTELWGNVDLRSEPLDVEIVKEWNEDGVVCRYILYTVCTFRDVPCRVAAFYTFPEGAEKGPAFVWAHGGGQRAERNRGEYFARQGYATIDINWGGREIVEGIEENTDWGVLDPSQGPAFYAGALRPNVKLDLKPDEHTIDSVPSPRNGNWFLLTYAGRRAITFLEEQPEVDPEKIGFAGYSMGGNMTAFSAIDPRLKAAIPMVGGTGFLCEDFPGVPGTARGAHFANADLFARTNDTAVFWPHIRCPVLVLDATNDFHGIMDRAFRCVGLLPHRDSRLSFNLHYNHSLGAEQWILINRWFDYYLKETGEPLPPTPESSLEWIDDHTVSFSVNPAGQEDLESVEILYSHDPNPQVRFWKTAYRTEKRNAPWKVELPVRPNLPIFAFAQCTYGMGVEEEAFAGKTDSFSITSNLAVFMPEEMKLESLREGSEHRKLFHDFSSDGLSGWGTHAGGGGIRTYRMRDPERSTPPAEAALVCEFGDVKEKVSFRIRISKNEFLGNQKPKETYVFAESIQPGVAIVKVSCSDFVLQGGEKKMTSWEDIVHLTVQIMGIRGKEHSDLTRGFVGTNLRKMTWE